MSPGEAFAALRPDPGRRRVVRRDVGHHAGHRRGPGATCSRRRACRTTARTSPDAPESGSTADQERPRSIIGIVDLGSDLVDGNIWALLGLLGAINLIVGLFNLIPLLPFDGGHAAVAVYEGIASKVQGKRVQVDYQKLIPVSALVLVVFLTLGVSAMVLDVRGLFRRLAIGSRAPVGWRRCSNVVPPGRSASATCPSAAARRSRCSR